MKLNVARCLQKLNKLQEAANEYQQLVKDFPKAPQEIEARFRLGEVQMAMGQQAEARRTWQDLLAAHADDKSERIPEATFKIAETYGLPTPPNAESLNLGVAALENFLKKYPEHKLAGQANLRIAQSYLNLGRHDDAVKALDRFLGDKRYADREEIADARNLLGQAYQLQKKFPEALAAWREYLAKHPAHHDWSQVQQAIVNTEYLLGAEKAALKQYDEARKLWTEFLAKYPLDGRNPRHHVSVRPDEFQPGKMGRRDRRLAAAGVEISRHERSFAGAVHDCPHAGNEARQARRGARGIQKSELGQPAAPQATLAVKRLTSKTLAIATERVFRTNETPKIKLTSRNIDTVTVRAYKVDLETYFRKMHEVRGVEGLDIALIDPDKTFEFKVPKYAEYQQLESEIEVPLPTKGKDGKEPTPA